MENNNIIISDDQDTTAIYDISDRIFELRDDISLDIISRNIIDRFDEEKNYETTNYITKFKERYQLLKEKNSYDGDIDILNNALQELSELFITKLSNTYFVSIGDEIDDDLTLNLDDYLDNIETLYTFFIVRHYTNIKDYFKSKLMTNKLKFVEKYKAALDDKSYDDLFLSQDKKKFYDVSDAIIIHFINDIIHDIRSSVESGYEFFKEIVNLDLFEEYNNRMNNLLINYGNEFLILDDHNATNSYLKMLDDNEIFVSLRNDLLSIFLMDAKINDK